MSTRCAIGINDSGVIKGIYCHWNGYPSHTGKILLENYSSSNKVNELVALGDLSILGSEIGYKHEFNKPIDKDWCLAYGRDRNEKDTEAVSASSRAEFVDVFKGAWCEYYYLFEDNKWYVSSNGDDWEPLSTVVSSMENE